MGSLLSGQDTTRWLRRLSGDRRVWVFNASVPGGDLLSSEAILREMLRRGLRPRHVLIEMCPPAIAQHNPWTDLFMRRQLRWNDLPAHAADLAREHQLLRLAQVRLLPLYGYRERICKEAIHVCAHWWQGGEAQLAGRPTEPGAAPEADDAPVGAVDWDKVIVKPAVDDDHREISQRALPYLQRILRAYHPGGTLAAALERIIALCQSNEIEPILVGVPVTSTFREAVTPAMEADYRTFLAQFCQSHHCAFVDYYAALPDSLFIDFHHGTPKGAEMFGYRLTVDVLAPVSQQISRRN
jgi:hypothetical protein